MKTRWIRYRRIIKHIIQYLFTANSIYWNEVQHYYYMKKFNSGNWFIYHCEWQNKIQKAYTEIWQTQLYPLSTRGKPKADDILKKYFPTLKA